MNLRLQRLLKLHGLMDQATGDEGGKATGGGGVDSGNGGGGQDGEEKPGKQGEDGAKGGDDTPSDGDDKGKQTALSDNEAKLLRESMERKNKIRELEAQLKRYEGLDPDEMRKLLKAEAERKQAEAEARGEFDAVKKQMAEAHNAEIAQKEQVIADKDAELAALKARIADMTVGQDFNSSKFIGDELALTPRKARTVYGAHFEFSEEHGRVVGYDKPAGAAGRAPLVDAKGDPLPFDEALRKLVDADPDREHMLKATTKPGAASSTQSVKPIEPTGHVEPKGVSRISAALKAQTK